MNKSALFILAFFSVVMMTPPSLAQPRQNLLLVYEDKPNSNRFLGFGTAIPKENPGLTVELLRMTAQKLGINLKFQRMPWKRCEYMVQHGLAHGMFHASYNRERTQYALYPMKDGKPDPSRAVFTQSYHFYAAKQRHVEWDGLELRNHGAKPVGITLGYSVAKDLDELDIRYVEFADQETGLISLVEDRVGALAGLANMMDPAIKESSHRFQTVEKLFPPIRTKPYYVVFSHTLAKTDPTLPDRFWNTMKKMEGSAAFKKRIRFYQQAPT